MAFFKRRYEDFRVLLIAFLYIIPFTATFDTDCNGKSFHCVNSTHFKICVDVGGGVSMAVDNIVIECPTSTICQNTNNFECEYQESTTRNEFIEKSEVTNDPVNLNVISLDHVDPQMSTLTEDEITSVLPLINPMIFSTTNQPSDINVTNVRSDARSNIPKMDEMLTKELTNDNSKFETNNESEHIYDGNKNLKNNVQPPFMQAKSKLYQLQNNTFSKFDRSFVTTESVTLSDFNHNLYDPMNFKNDPTTITPVERLPNNISNITDNVSEIENKDTIPNEMKKSSTRSTIPGNLDMKSMLLPIEDHDSTLKSEIGNGIIKAISVNGENGDTEDTIIQTALANSFAHTTASQNLITENTFSDLAIISSNHGNKLGERQTEMANDTNKDDKISSLKVTTNTTTYVQGEINKNYDKPFLNNTLIEVLSNNTGLENSTDPNLNISDVEGRGNFRNNKSPLTQTELGNENASSTVLKNLKSGSTFPERPKPNSKKDGKSETEISNIPELENTTSQTLNLGVDRESGSSKNNKDTDRVTNIQTESENSSANSTLSQSLKTQNIFSEINDTSNRDAKTVPERPKPSSNRDEKSKIEIGHQTNKDDSILLSTISSGLKINAKSPEAEEQENRTPTEVLSNIIKLKNTTSQTLNLGVHGESGSTSNNKDTIMQTELEKSSANSTVSQSLKKQNIFSEINDTSNRDAKTVPERPKPSSNQDEKSKTEIGHQTNKDDSTLSSTISSGLKINAKSLEAEEQENRAPTEVLSNIIKLKNTTSQTLNLGVHGESGSTSNNKDTIMKTELEKSSANSTVSQSLKKQNIFSEINDTSNRDAKTVPERPKPSSNQDEKSKTDIGHQTNKDDSTLSSTISSGLKINAKSPEAEEKENRAPIEVLSNIIKLKNMTSQTSNLGVHEESGSTRNNKDTIMQTELEKSSANSTVSQSLKTQNIFSDLNDTSNRDAKFEAEIATGTNKVDDNYLLNIPLNKTIKTNVQTASNPESNKSFVYETSTEILCNNTELECMSVQSLNFTVDGENGTTSNKKDPITQTESDKSSPNTRASNNFETDNTFPDLNTISGNHDAKLETGLLNDTNKNDNISLLNVTTNITIYVNPQETRNNNPNFDKHLLNDTLIEVTSNNTGLENSTDSNLNLSVVEGSDNIRNNKSVGKQMELDNSYANLTVSNSLKTENTVPERPKPNSNQDEKLKIEIGHQTNKDDSILSSTISSGLKINAKAPEAEEQKNRTPTEVLSNIIKLKNTTSQALNLGVHGESGSTSNNKDTIMQTELEKSSANSTVSQSLKTQNIFSEINDTSNRDAKFEAEVATETNKFDDNYLLNIPLNKAIKTNVQKATDSNPDSNKYFVYETSTELLCNNTDLECMSGQSLNFTVDGRNGTISDKKDTITQTESDKSSPHTRASHNFGTGNMFPDLNIISGKHDAQLETGMLNDTNENDNISLLNVTTNTTIFVSAQETRNNNPNFNKHLPNNTLIEVTSNNTGLENSTDPNSNLSVVEGSDNIRNVVKQMESDNSYVNLTVSKSLKTENTFPERPKPSSNQDEKLETKIGYQVNKDDSILSSTISSGKKINAKAAEAEEKHYNSGKFLLNRTLTEVVSNITELKNTTSQTLNLGVFGKSSSTRNNKDTIIQTELENSSANSTVSQSLKSPNIYPEINDTSNRDAKFEAEIAMETNKVDDNYLLNIPLNKTIRTNVQKAIDSNPDSNKSFVYEISTEVLCNNTELECMSGQTSNLTVDTENRTTSNKKDPITQTDLDKSSPNTRASHNFGTANTFPDLNIISGNHDAKLKTGMLYDTNKNDNISLLNVTTNTKIYVNPQEIRNKNPNFDKHLLNDTLIEVTSNNTGLENSTDPNSNLSVVEGNDNIRNSKGVDKQMELDNSYASPTVSKSLKTENTFPERPKPSSNQDETSETEIEYQTNKNDNILSSTISSGLKINAKAPEAEEKHPNSGKFLLNRTLTEVVSNITELKNTSQTLNLGVFGESSSIRNSKDTIIQTELEKSSANSTVSLKSQNIFPEINDSSNHHAKFEAEIATETNKVDDNYLLNIPLNKTIKTNVQKAIDSNPDSNKSFVYETSTEVLCNNTELECMSGQTSNLTVDTENRTTSNKKDPITQTELDKSSPNTRASHNFGTANTFPDLNIISGNHDAKLETGMLYDTNKNDNISLLNTKIYVNPQEMRNKNPNFDKYLLNDSLIEITSNNTGLENSTDPNSNLSVVEGNDNIRNSKGVVKQMELDNSYASPTVSKRLKTENTFPERPKPSSNQDETSETEIAETTISSSIKLNPKAPEAEGQENRTPTEVLSNIIKLKNTTSQTLNLGGNGESDSTRDPVRQTELSHAYVNSTVSKSIVTTNAIAETDKFSSNSKFKPKAEITQETNRDDNISFLNINSNATIYENAKKPLRSYMNTDFPKSSLKNTLPKAFSNGTVLGNTTTQNVNFSTNGKFGKIRNNVDIYELTKLKNSSAHSLTLGKLNTENKLLEMLNNLSSEHDHKLSGGIVNEPNSDYNSSLIFMSATTTNAYSALKHNSEYDKSFVNETLVEDLSDNYEFEKMQKSNATGEIIKNNKDLNYSAQSTLIANLKTQSVVTENPKASLDYGYKSITNKTNVHENISLNNVTEIKIIKPKVKGEIEENTTTRDFDTNIAHNSNNISMLLIFKNTSSLRKYLNDEEAETSTSPNVMNIHNVTDNFTPQMFKVSNLEGDSSAYLYSSTTTKPSIKNITSVFTSIPKEGSMENKTLKIIKDLRNDTHSLSQNHVPYKEIENNVTMNVSEKGIAKNGTKQTNDDREGNLIDSRKKNMGNDLIYIKNFTEYTLDISRFNDTFVNKIQKDERVEQFKFDNMNSVNKNKFHEKTFTVETRVNRTEIFNNSNSNYIEYVTQYDMELPISSDRPSVLKSMAPNVQIHDKNTEPTLEGSNSLNNAPLIENQTDENNTTSDVSPIKKYTPIYVKIKKHHIERTNSSDDEERFPVTLFGIKDAIQTTTARMAFINISNLNNSFVTSINSVEPTTAAKMLINKISDLRGENLKHKKLFDNNNTNTHFNNISEVTTVKSINDNDTKYDNTYTHNILVAAVDNNKTIKPSCFDGLCAESKEEKFFSSSLKSRNESILDDDALPPSNHNNFNIDRGIRILPNKKEPIKNNDDVNIFSSPDLIKIVTKFSIDNFTINKNGTTISNTKLKEPLSELRSPNEVKGNVNYPNKISSNLHHELTMVIETNNRTYEVNKTQLDYRSIKINSSNYTSSYNRSNVTPLLDYNKSNENKTTNVDKINTGYTEIKQGISLILRDEKNLLDEKNDYQKVLVNSRSKSSFPNFICRNNSRGRFADKIDCRRFYICIGNPVPILGLCPVNTVFSEIRKQCTRNLSHCIRNYQFKCVKEGRFSDVWHENIYYLCIKDANQEYVRFKFQCQNGFHLDKINIICHKVMMTSKTSTSSSSTSSKDKDLKVNKEAINKKPARKSSNFRCEEEGKFIDPSNCKRYYVCSKTSKAILRRKRKKCDSDEIFDNDKSKCVDKDSHEC